VTVLVTGAAGFLGSHVVRTLAEAGRDFRVYRGDIADREALTPALRGVDRVLNCAARTGPWGRKSDYEHSNVAGLETLVRASMAAGVGRVVHVSSITVHGNDVRGAVDESAPLREEPNPYSRTKVAGERLVQRLVQAADAPVTIVRPGWIYGPGDHASFGRLAQRIADGRMVMVGPGDNHLPLIYVSDAARGVVQAGDAADVAGRSYLLVNDEPVTQREYLAAIAAELGVPAPAHHLRYRLALLGGVTAETAWRLACRGEAPPVMRYGLQLLGGENRFVIERARRELGFEPHVNVAEGVRRAVAWYRAGCHSEPVAAAA
jgi:2-alkyl-3-oxoalkanoate reductase